jgi:signal transduction histidine kinase
MRFRTVLADAGLAVALTVFCLLLAAPAGRAQPLAHDVDARAYVLVAVACLVLAVRRRWPGVALAVAAVAISTYLTLRYPYGPSLLAVAVAVYPVVVMWPLRRAAIASAAALAVLLVHLFVWRSEGLVSALVALIPASAWIVVPFAVGTVVRLTRQARSREQSLAARRAADDERLRVAQEVHDVVGHGLAAITMQAEIALHLLPTRPEQAYTAFTAISATSREALDELRATLAVVRQNEPGGSDADARVPTAGLSRLGALTDRIAASGTPVNTAVTGEARALAPAVDLAAYRVVQEALTNVLRHAGPGATATVTIDYDADVLRVTVADTGSGAPAPEGHGIAGMRERTTALGGTLDVSDDYTVTAVFPT